MRFSCNVIFLRKTFLFSKPISILYFLTLFLSKPIYFDLRSILFSFSSKFQSPKDMGSGVFNSHCKILLYILFISTLIRDPLLLPIIWHNFCRKLHENEKIGLRGFPLDPLLFLIHSHLFKLPVFIRFLVTTFNSSFPILINKKRPITITIGMPRSWCIFISNIYEPVFDSC